MKVPDVPYQGMLTDKTGTSELVYENGEHERPQALINLKIRCVRACGGGLARQI